MRVGFGYNLANLTGDFYINFATTGANLFNLSYQSFQVATK